jgi:hypothetical protein
MILVCPINGCNRGCVNKNAHKCWDYRQRNPGHTAEYNREHSKYQSDWKKFNHESIAEHNREYCRRWRELNREKSLECNRKVFERKRDYLIIIRGGKCESCLEVKSNECLDFHHKYMDGDEERRKYNEHGHGLLRHWKRNIDDFNIRLRLLCKNCHSRLHYLWNEWRIRRHMIGKDKLDLDILVGLDILPSYEEMEMMATMPENECEKVILDRYV